MTEDDPGGDADKWIDPDDPPDPPSCWPQSPEETTAVALTNGVGFSCEQSFAFGAAVLGTSDLTFKRFATNTTTSVLKTIPQ